MEFIDRKRKRHPFSVAERKRPDIFVFTLDMVPPDFYRPGQLFSRISLPHWRRLEKTSVVFANAFSVSPLCSGSRASFFTGRYPYILVNEERSHDGFETELRPEEVIFPEYLKAAGYLTGHAGKSHIGTQAFLRTFGENCAPWNRWAPPVWDDADYHWYLKRAGVKLPVWKKTIRGLKPDRKSPGNFYGGWVQQEDGQPFPLQATYPHYLVNRALNHLETLLAKRKPGQPIYFQVDLFAPHQPFFIPAGLEERESYLRQQVSLPSSYQKWVSSGYQWDQPQPKIYQTYRLNWGLYEQETAFDYLIANMLQMEVIDAALGKFIEGLEKLNLYQESVFLLTADHGEMNLEQGLIDKGVYGHPLVARVPFLLKIAGQNAAETVAQPVCLLDVAPTILELAGIQPAASFDGESLLNRTKNPGSKRKPFLFECGWHVTANPAVALNYFLDAGRHYRYVYNLCSEIDEFYDLNDPENRNLIREPGLASLVKELRQQLFEILNQDVRWRCYLHAFRLDHHAVVREDLSDTQMFVPE